MQTKPSRPAHDLLGFILEKLLTPLNITVNNRMRLMAEAPEADVLLLMKGGTMQEYYLSPEKMLEIGRRYEDLLLANLSVEKRLAGLKPEERMIGLKPEERVIGLRPEERMIGLKPEEVLSRFKPEERVIGLRPKERMVGLKPEDILDNLSAEDIVAYLKKKRQLGSLQE